MKKLFRSIPPRIRQAAKASLERHGRQILWLPPPLGARPDARIQASFDLVLSHFLLRATGGRESAHASVIQIGAGDGALNDPLAPYLASGLLRGALVEPLSEAFAALRSRYAGLPHLQLHNAALSDQAGEATIFRVAPGTPGPEWIQQLASFDRDAVVKHAEEVPGLDRHVVEQSVAAITFEEVLEAMGCDRVDVLVIDAEGLDARILHWFDLSRRRPSVVHYEHIHLTDEARDRCLEQLLDLGYRIALEATDTTAYAAEAMDRSLDPSRGRP